MAKFSHEGGASQTTFNDAGKWTLQQLTHARSEKSLNVAIAICSFAFEPKMSMGRSDQVKDLGALRHELLP